MANKVLITDVFARKVRPLLKKYKSLGASLLALEKVLIENPRQGVSYGANIYKVRLTDPSKGKGTSGGFRVITFLVTERPDSVLIQFITILNKSEEASIKKEDVISLIKQSGLG